MFVTTFVVRAIVRGEQDQRVLVDVEFLQQLK